jgi:hypothetical protein
MEVQSYLRNISPISVILIKNSDSFWKYKLLYDFNMRNVIGDSCIVWHLLQKLPIIDTISFDISFIPL